MLQTATFSTPVYKNKRLQYAPVACAVFALVALLASSENVHAQIVKPGWYQILGGNDANGGAAGADGSDTYNDTVHVQGWFEIKGGDAGTYGNGLLADGYGGGATLDVTSSDGVNGSFIVDGFANLYSGNAYGSDLMAYGKGDAVSGDVGADFRGDGQGNAAGGNVTIQADTARIALNLDLKSGHGEAVADGTGTGGTVSMTVNRNLQVDNQLILTGESAWAHGEVAAFGRAGDVFLTTGADALIGNGVQMTGGLGAAEQLAAGTSNRAEGGNVRTRIGGNLTVNAGDVWMTGGRAYGAADSALGGNAVLSVDNSMYVNGGDVILTAGDGENSGFWGNGAIGGSAGLDVANVLYVQGILEMNSGNDIQTGVAAIAGTGGYVELNAGTLVVPQIDLNKNDGDLTARIGLLDLSQNDTTMNLNATTAWDGATGVSLGDLVFGSGRTLTVSQAAGGTMLAAGNITVNGPGATYYSAVDYDASGRNLNFVLPANVQNGDTMLDVQGGAAVDVNSAMVSMTPTGALTQLTSGSVINLITSTTGAVSNTGDYDVLLGATRYNFEILSNPNNLQALYRGTAADPDFSQGYAQGMVGSLNALIGGSDLLMDAGYASAQSIHCSILGAEECFLQARRAMPRSIVVVAVM